MPKIISNEIAKIGHDLAERHRVAMNNIENTYYNERPKLLRDKKDLPAKKKAHNEAQNEFNESKFAVNEFEKKHKLSVIQAHEAHTGKHWPYYKVDSGSHRLTHISQSNAKLKESKESMNESEDKVHTVYVRHNYYEGKHYNNGGRAYPVLAKSPEEAESIAKTHKDKIESHLRTLKVKSGNASRNLIAKSDKYHLKDEDIHVNKLKPTSMFQSTHRNVIDRNGNFPNKKVNEMTESIESSDEIHVTPVSKNSKMYRIFKTVSNNKTKKLDDTFYHKDNLNKLGAKVKYHMNEMTDETINLIGAIASGDTIASAQMFGSVLMSKISDLIDSRRQEVAQNMFANESSEDLDDSIIDEEKIKRTRQKSAKNSDDKPAMTDEDKEAWARRMRIIRRTTGIDVQLRHPRHGDEK